ncbi:MAG: mucoidy inhibitor MuiA family protein [Verrucomicrobia bacterium]|nr:mucoidy inhibitor MuiA family protein [Verrucomicrobiota bacterium]
MRKTALPLAALLWAGHLSAAPIDTSSQISAVTVYADRARVTRTAEVALPEGESVVRLAGLPADLDPSSVQAGGTGTGVKILGLEIRDVFFDQTVNPRVRELEAQLQALQDQEATLVAKKADLQERRTFLNKVRDGLAQPGAEEGKGASSASLEKVKPLYEFYGAETVAISEATQANAVAIREIGPKKQVVVDELNRLRSGGGKTEKQVLVAVKASSPAKATLSLGYNMSGASWQPLYDARVNTQTGAIELAYYGNVRQQTGENWDNVKLSLSTARPSVGARMPELEPWWLNFIRPMAVSKRNTFGYSAGADADAAKDKEEMVVAAAPAPMEYEQAEIESSGVSVVFEIKIPATIPSDGEEHRVAIATQKFDGKIEYVTTPKLADVAFLKTRLTNSSGAPILGGKVNVFRDGDFIGDSHVNFIAPGEDFDFYLGTDDNVKVTRKTLVDRAAENGLFQKRKGITRKYETTLENFKNQPVKVTVLDQLPVAQDASITVRDVKFSDTPVQDKDTGKLTWTFDLAPKQKKQITEEFTVDWPSEKDVVF